MSYAWIIDIDHLTDPLTGSEAGINGPGGAPKQLTDLLHIGALTADDGKDEASVQIDGRTITAYRFRMYDGDRILYYTGRLITDEDASEQALFGPLDDFGRPNAGCTEIRYKNADGKWEGL